MRRTTFSAAQRVVARIVLLALLHQWTIPAAFAARQQTPEPEPLPLASTITAIANGQTHSFTDKTLIGKDASEFVGKWIRVFTDDKPAGLIIQITAFNTDTGEVTLQDALPAGAVDVNDVYHLAESRDVLLPSNVDPSSIGLGSIGCAPAGTNQDDTITCFAIDATGVTAQKGDDTVAVTSPTVVLVTKFGSDKKDESEAKAIDLGDGNDRIVNDGTIVSAAIALVSETPKNPSEEKAEDKKDEEKKDEEKKEDTAVAAKAEPTAIGIDAGDGQNVITNNGRVSTSATSLLLARELPGEAKEQKSADVSSTATSTSTAVQAGDDGSFITNTGRLASRAIAVAAGVGITTSSKDEPASGESTPAGEEAKKDAEKKDEEKEEKANNFTFKGDVGATATATGITTGSGTDTVTNTDEIIVTASAITVDAGAAQIQAQGKAAAGAAAASTSTAQGLVLGDGNDTVINSGSISTSATSRAISLEIAVADKNNASKPGSGSENGNGSETPKQEEKKEEPKELSSTIDGSATATSEATGIRADTGEAKPESDPIFKLGTGNLTVGRETTETRPGGNDSVTNSGTLNASATSRSIASGGGITIDGNASAKITSTATATSTGADLGAGNDALNNSGTITSTADATATALGIAVAQKATPSKPAEGGGEAPAETPKEEEKNTAAIKTTVEGSATATATATGITADGALSSKEDKWTATAGLPVSVAYTQESRTTQASGTDTVTNSGAITTTATTLARAGSVGISADGAASIKATSTADSAARGIDLGAGNDTLTNTVDGTLTTIATATANALSLSIGFKTDQSVKAEVQSAANVETNATARATGVSADGVAADTAQTVNLAVSSQQLSLGVTQTTTLASGNDVVTNDGTIVTTATATTTAVGLALSTEGKSTVSAQSTGVAESAAIDLGRGNDTLTNTGSITAVSTATANALGISVGTTSGSDPPTTPPATPPASLDSAANASATATASSAGISADSLAAETTRQLQLQIGGGPSFLTGSATDTRPGGDDTVTNSGTVDASASATSGALSGSLTTDGKAAAKLTSTAEASAAGIDLGGGSDMLTNTGGTVTATADALAIALAASIGMKSDPNAKSTAESATDASVKANARAIGVAADAVKQDTAFEVTLQHLEQVLSLTATASLTRPSGDDTVSNAASVTAGATATSQEIAASVTIDGKAAAKADATATAEAAGIDLGGGSDRLTSNTGTVTVTADSTANALTVAVGVQSSGGGTTPPAGGSGEAVAAAAKEKPKATPGAGGAAVEASVTSTANAIGISADSLLADTAGAGLISVGPDGLKVHVETSETRGNGTDTVTNDGAITTTATSNSVAIGVGASVGGNATVKTSSEANATATAIDLGGGNDTATNNGALTASATSNAQAVSLALVGESESSSSEKAKRAKSTTEAGATAEARATGLSADSSLYDKLFTVDLTIGDSLADGVTFGFLKSTAPSTGDDIVTNTGTVHAEASATTLSAAVTLVAEGAATARTTSEATAVATGIGLGGGADNLFNTGNLTAISTATAGGVGISLTNKGSVGSSGGFFAASEGLWKGGVEAKSTAVGIDGTGGATTSKSLTVALSGDIGLDVRFEDREDSVTADKADVIRNTGNIEATATANAGTINVAATAEGAAGAISDVESSALAVGIRGGQGNDTIDNLGFDRVTLATATALTGGLTIAVSGKSINLAADTLWSSGTKAEATAIGIDGDGGILKLKNIVFLGTSLDIDKTETDGTGNDVITNQQIVAAFADATAPALGVAYAAEHGVAATISSVETSAAATAIRGGGGIDTIRNFGQLFVGASALSVAANIAISKERGAAAGGAIWHGGTKAEATAVGIDGDGVSTNSKSTSLLVSNTGVLIVHEKKEDAIAGAGNDTIDNAAAIGVSASAESDALAVAGTAKGVSAAFAQSTTEATAAAIRGGAGSDTITNSGELNAASSSIARALNVSIETTGGLAIAANNVFDGGTTAEARSTGIAGDGGSTSTTTRTISIGDGGDLANKVKTEVAATGDDTIVNTAKIDVGADARTLAGSAAVPIKGMGVSATTSTAEAVAAAIDAGSGNNSVTNSGELIADASATAATANVAVTNAGVAIAADAVWNGGTTARATANGITAGDGQTPITNSGLITVDSSAITLSGSVAVAVSGVAGATATSTSESRATGIAGGRGLFVDTLTNHGAINVNAFALAATAAVSVTNAGLAISADSFWDGGTTARAVARGIGDTGGPDSVLNGGRIEVTANANTASANVPVAVTGVAAALATGTADANASAIDLGAGGADLLINRGRLITDALALAGTVNVAVTTAGVAAAGNDVWDGGTNALAVARTIYTGDGNDVVTNAGDVSANSDAATAAVNVAVAVSGVGVAIGTSTATSVATAIDAGDGDNTVTNRDAGITDRTGKLVAEASAHAVTATVAVTTAGVAGASDSVWNGGTTADAAARGIRTSVGGNDTIDNGGAIDATSTARSGSGNVAVAVAGVAVALANSTALSSAAAIDTSATAEDAHFAGPDQDTVTNRRVLTINSNAFALSLPVSVTTAGLAVSGTSVWDGGTTADAKAKGITTGVGDDVISNHGAIAADADATTGSAAVSVSVAGVAASIATSTAKAEASAIDAGAGADRITNTAKVGADTTALAGTVTVSVTPAGVAVAGDAVWDGGTKGEATSRTIAAGDGDDRVRNVGDVSAIADAKTASVAVSVAVAGVGVSSATSTATSTATAIDLGAGNDTVINMDGGATDRTGTLTANAVADAVAASVTVTPAGVAISSDAVWRGGTTGTATAAAIDGGRGADTVVNSSDVDVDAKAFTGTLSAAITVFGVAAALVSSTTNATGVGITTGDDVRTDGNPIDTDLVTEQDLVMNTGRLVVDVESLARSIGIGFSFGGVAAAADSFWDGGTTANAWARGIGLGNGADTLFNAGDVDISSLASAVSANLSVTVFGVSAAASTATATARSTALDGGDGNDVVSNAAAATLTSDANAIGRGTTVSFVAIGATAAGDTVWNGGTKADAHARGIDGGLGNDTLTNDGTIAATGDSTTSSVSVAITGIGVGAAAATSTSTGAATAIDGGDGNDTITSRGNATATAISNATGVAVQATGIGAGAEFDSFNGGTQAITNATGLAGGAGDDTVTLAEKKVTAAATSEANSTSVSVTLVGVAGGAAASTSTATATGIDGGTGVDTITANAEIASTANATATGNTIVVSTLGSVAGAFDSTTKAESNAIGVAGGEGNDAIAVTGQATTTLSSTATTTATNVSVAVAGFGLSDSRAVSTSRGTGVAGDAGNDTIAHEGTLSGTLTAESKSRAVAVTAAGVLSLVDASGRSEIIGTGIDGGAGDDTIENRSLVNLGGTATARANGVSVLGTGAANADAVTASDATITGLQGGAGLDTVTNAIGGNVTADATAETIASSRSVSLIAIGGQSSTENTPTASATGLDGGADNDTVVNNASVTARSLASSSATNFSFQLTGGAATSAGTVATANATGLAGGDGHDTVVNHGLVTATGSSTASVTNSSWSLSGAANDSSLFRAGGLVAGITGGAGADRLLNDGFLTVDFTSTLRADSKGRNIFGGATSNTQLTAAGGAVGIAGDADNDLIHNAGTIDVTAKSDVGTTNAMVSFATGSTPSADALLKADANATGLGGGAGDNGIRNSGDLFVRAEGVSNISGGAEATVLGSPRTAGFGTANATARGVQADDGSNSIANIGAINVLATGDAVTTNSSTSGLLFSTGRAEADGRSTVNAFGIAAGAGSNSITNNLDLLVTANASAYANAYASGSHVAINGAATTHADGRATATATGITAGGGANTIINRGLMSVLALAGTTRDITRKDEFCSTEVVTTEEQVTDENGPVFDEMGNPVMKTVKTEVPHCVEKEVTLSSSPTYAAANGNGANGVGRATAVATANGNAVGVQTGNGANVIANFGDINVTARPTARAIAFADGDLLAEAFGTATANATATAIGIKAGTGSNEIYNVGTLTVLAEPTVRANVDVTTAAPICINYFFGEWCGDGGIGTATANVTSKATAIGIQTGNGNNLVVNDGVLSVTAAPTSGDPITITHADHRFENPSFTASAIGIQTGTGNDTIVNNGTINVSTAGLAISTAIDAGEGHDRVVLGSGSHTNGNVLLGAGDDRLVWGAGASIAGTVNLGGGSNIFALGGSTNGTLNLSGAGPIAGMNIFTSFNGFRKEGSSTWTLTGARNMNWTVEGGTLEVAGAVTGTIATEASLFANPVVAVNLNGLIGSVGAAPAVRLQTNGVLINEGHIAALGTAVDATTGTVSAVYNDGTIQSATGLAILGGNGSEQVTNWGVITGGAGLALDLGAGDDTLTIFDSSIINGVSHGGLGTDQLILGSPTGVLDLTTFATNFTSFEQTTLQQASFWTLAGNGALDLTVDQGLLNVVGNVTGSLKSSGKGNAQIFVDASGSVTSDDRKPAVALDGPSSLVNGGTVTGSVHAFGQGSSVLNAGSIYGEITASGHGSSVQNFGLIENPNGVAVMGGDGAQHVENHGLIVSGKGTAVDLGDGDDVLLLSTGSGVVGSMRGGNGADTLRLTGNGGARLDLNTIAAFEKLRKEGSGAWLVTGSSSMAWDNVSGTLVLAGSLTGPGSNAPGALFAGNGTVGSLTNAGIVSPGMSLGAINVAGDYAQTSTGVLQIEGSIFSDLSDRLNVTGTASLDGTLEILPELRPFGVATEYTILEAQGGVSGTFATTTNVATNLDTHVDYLPKSVTVALVRNDISFAEMSEPADLPTLGAALDASKRSMAVGDFKPVMDQFLTMDAAQQTSALRSLSGEFHASLPTTLLRIGEQFFSASATRRLNAEQQRGGRMTMWTDYVRFTGDQRGHGQFAGSTYASDGLVAGADVALGGGVRLGGSFGYASGSSELDRTAAGDARLRSLMPAVYGEYAAGPVLVQGAFGYADHTVRTARLIEVGAVRRQARADYTADQYSGLLRVSYAVPVGRAVAMAPFVETRRSQVTRRGFDETGAESLNLSGVDAFTVNGLRTLVGVRTSSARRLFGSRVEPELSLAWTREGQDLRSGMQGFLSGMTSRPGFSSFALNGISDSRTGGLVNAGATVGIAGRGRAFVAYDGFLTDVRTEHSFAAGLRVIW